MEANLCGPRRAWGRRTARPTVQAAPAAPWGGRAVSRLSCPAGRRRLVGAARVVSVRRVSSETEIALAQIDAALTRIEDVQTGAIGEHWSNVPDAEVLEVETLGIATIE